MRWSIAVALAALVGAGAARVHAQKPQATASPPRNLPRPLVR